MEVVLLERIENLGQMGDVVNVKNGYARNYLLPKKKALRATRENIAHFEQQRAQLEAENLSRRQEAEAVAGRLDGETFIIIRQAGETGQLYGSVATRDIAERVTEGGVTIGRNQVVLHAPIKTLGLHKVRIQLHPEVNVNVTLNVARNEDEASRQAQGLAVTGVEAEDMEQAVLAAEEVFETEELAEEALETLEEIQTEEEASDSDAQAAEAADKK